MTALEPFDKWEIDFFGPINLTAHHMGVYYIITMTEYLTWWARATLIK
jgi:hypothetical protein